MKAGRPQNSFNTQKIHEGPYMFDVLVIDYFQQVANISDGLVCDELADEMDSQGQSQESMDMTMEQELSQYFQLYKQELIKLNERMGLQNFEQDFLLIGQRIGNSVSDIFAKQYVKLIYSVFRCINKSQEQIQKIKNQFFQSSKYFSLKGFIEVEEDLHKLKRANKKQPDARYNFLKKENKNIKKKQIKKRLRIIAKLEKNLNNKKKRKGRLSNINEKQEKKEKKEKKEKIQSLIQVDKKNMIGARFTKLFNDLVKAVTEIKNWPLFVSQQKLMIQYLEKIINHYSKQSMV